MENNDNHESNRQKRENSTFYAGLALLALGTITLSGLIAEGCRDIQKSINFKHYQSTNYSRPF